jgi:hypothetical protein
MKHIVELSDLKTRAAAIRWPLGDLSVAAGRARCTAYQIVSHGNPKRATQQALIAALVREETRILLHLAALHPDLVTINQPKPGAKNDTPGQAQPEAAE